MRWNADTEAALLARINDPKVKRQPRWGLRLAFLLAVTFAVVMLMVIPNSGVEPGFEPRPCPVTAEGYLLGPPTAAGTVCGR